MVLRSVCSLSMMAMIVLGLSVHQAYGQFQGQGCYRGQGGGHQPMGQLHGGPVYGSGYGNYGYHQPGPAMPGPGYAQPRFEAAFGYGAPPIQNGYAPTSIYVGAYQTPQPSHASYGSHQQGYRSHHPDHGSHGHHGDHRDNHHPWHLGHYLLGN